MDVTSIGKQITVKVNGIVTAVYRDDDKPQYTIGHLGLQQHNPQTIVEFRPIKIKELTSRRRHGARSNGRLVRA